MWIKAVGRAEREPEKNNLQLKANSFKVMNPHGRASQALNLSMVTYSSDSTPKTSIMTSPSYGGRVRESRETGQFSGVRAWPFRAL